MTDRISDNQGPGPLSPQDKKAYEREYKEGVALFKRTLDDYPKSNSKFQKEAFKDVMEQAMQVLNDAAAGLKRSDLLNQNEQIEKDLAALQKQDNPSSLEKLEKDLDKAKKSIG